MAKNRQPVLKRCKTLGLSPAVLGYSKETRRNPKQMRRKQSEFGLQLNEKQKVNSSTVFWKNSSALTMRKLNANRA